MVRRLGQLILVAVQPAHLVRAQIRVLDGQLRIFKLRIARTRLVQITGLRDTQTFHGLAAHQEVKQGYMRRQG